MCLKNFYSFIKKKQIRKFLSKNLQHKNFLIFKYLPFEAFCDIINLKNFIPNK